MQYFISIVLAIFVTISGLRAQTEEKLYLIFSARAASLKPFSLAGHAFVSWGTKKVTTDSMNAPLTLGLYPDHDATMFQLLFTGLPGDVVEGFESNSRKMRTYQTTFAVSDTQWNAALDTALVWEGKRYHLLRSNCVDFMDNVAEAAGLKTPAARICYIFPRRPTVYLRKLIKMNHQEALRQRPPIKFEKGVNAPDIIVLD